MIPIFAELPFANPRLRPVCTIGKTEPHSGMRHGMDDYGRGPTELVSSVNSANEDPDAEETNEWGIKVAAQLDEQSGSPRCLDLSGHFGSKFINGQWDSIQPYIDAIARTTSFMRSPFTKQDLIWANLENPFPPAVHARAMRALADSGAIGQARLVCTWVYDGSKDLIDKTVTLPRTFGACDLRTAYIPAMLEKTIDPTSHVQWVERAMMNAADKGLDILLHIKGGRGIDGQTAYTDEQFTAWCKIVDLAHRHAAHLAGVLVYSIYGQGNTIILQEIDGVKRAADDAAVIAAFSLADADRRGG